MPTIVLFTLVNAPIESVFDLSRSIDFHQMDQTKHHEKAIAGVTTGLINLGETVTWQATHFGIRQKLTTQITHFNRPFHFRDSQVRGAFHSFDHDHWFTEQDNGTMVIDRFEYQAPLGSLGRIADILFLKNYMQKFLIERNLHLKATLESGSFHKYLHSNNRGQ